MQTLFFFCTLRKIVVSAAFRMIIDRTGFIIAEKKRDKICLLTSLHERKE